MTVVPRSAGAAVLICDRCGVQENATATGHDQEVVWPLVADAGWTGSAFALGPHRCPRCGDAVPEPAPAVREPSPSAAVSYAVRAHHDLDAVVVTPLADLDAGLAEVLREGLTTARHVVLDLHAVHLIDSAGLGLLVRTHQEAKHRGGSFRLAAPSRYVLTVLHTMRLDAVFAIHPDAEAALRAVHPDPQ